MVSEYQDKGIGGLDESSHQELPKPMGEAELREAAETYIGAIYLRDHDSPVQSSHNTWFSELSMNDNMTMELNYRVG